ncbi:MAG TPA: isoprenylcysteine carboxylmethyltransferase family protein [Vicinamibacterales bacterium]|nr:isoprenylcysteine carboxylmethyltransferase family protein [Vicinamibacterales bacterium]
MLMLLRQLLAVLALPFTVTVVIPVWIARRNAVVFAMPGDVAGLVMVGIGAVCLGGGLVLFAACVFYFWTRGRGTLAPWDPPRRFVAEGPYRFVRNPMISGVILAVAGEALLLRSRPIAEWAALFTLINLVYIPLLEEPRLEARFGETYTRYLRAVPRFMPRLGPRPWLIFVVAFVVYNSNGREIQSYDSQPTKYAARELALHGRLTLDAVVASAPPLGERSAFQRDLSGRYRSAYSVVPSIEAAGVAWLLNATGLVDLTAPLAPGLIAALTASLLTAGAVALVFAALARRADRRTAALVALGLGFGTNLWPLASRSLWQLETVSFGFALALHAWLRPPEAFKARHVWIGAAGLALAGSARLETAPAIAVLLAGLVVRLGIRRASPALVLVAAAGAVLMAAQWSWFGSVLGAKMILQSSGLEAHGVTGTFSAQPWYGALGLLLSPSRGLILFSPIVLVPLLGLPIVWRQRSDAGDRWWTAAALLQYAGYSCYSMWWGGHTYGPRYLVDALVPLTPAAAAGIGWVVERRWRQAVGTAALAWSVAVAATGAFCYPNDRWNTDPADVDRHHDRLWDWRDPQIVRAWQRGMSPQNFSLFTRSAVRRPPAQ